MTTYTDLGYSRFLTKSIFDTNTLSTTESRNLFASGFLDDLTGSTSLGTVTDIVFSSTDNDTAAWTEGKIYFADGTVSETIAASNTGNISATTYVYYDENQPGGLLSTTTITNAAGKRKYLLAIVSAGAAGKDCKIIPCVGDGLVVSGLTAANISVTQLDALAVNTGTLNVDEYITLGSDANVKIDGTNKRILISDGTNDRILIGYQASGF